MHFPSGLAVDSRGVLFIVEDSRIRRVGANGIITTVAGGADYGYSGDGGPAVLARLYAPNGIAVDGAGNLFIADLLNQRIRKVSTDGVIRTVVGTGVSNFTGDGGPASFATLSEPTGIAVDPFGNVYVGDSANYRVRKIDPAGKINTYAGNGNFGFAGEGIQAREAVFNSPSELVVDPAGNIYVADSRNHRVRKIAPDGVITTVAGGSARGFAGDGGPGTQALLSSPGTLAVDGVGNLYIADGGNARVRKVDTNGIISTFAGGGSPLSGNGDGGPAVDASFRSVSDITFDTKGNLYVLDAFATAIRRVSPSGTITTVVNGLIPVPVGIAVDATGNIYVSQRPQAGDRGSGGGVFRISPGEQTFSKVGDFLFPRTVDAQGNLYVPSSNQVFRLTPDGTQTVVAGSGQIGFSGDDGPATQAALNGPVAVALDAAGNLYITDQGNNRIRKVFLNSASGLFEPKLQTTLQPGYYLATVTLGQGEHPGYWGMEVLAPVGVFAGGLNLGGTLQQRSLPPGFGGFFLPTQQTVHLHVDARPADGGDTSNVQVGVRLLDVNKKPVTAEKFGGTSVDFTETLPAGYYVTEIRGGDSSPLENFLMSVEAAHLSGGVVVGGYAGVNTVGYSGFYLTAPQQITIRMYGQPSYGADGAGGVRLMLYDAGRNVIATVP